MKRQMFIIRSLAGVGFTLLVILLFVSASKREPLNQTQLTSAPSETIAARMTAIFATRVSISSTANAIAKLTDEASIPALHKWKAANINNYTIVVTDNTYMRNMRFISVIRNGKLMRGDFGYSVDGLFERLKYKEQSAGLFTCNQSAGFEPNFGFPSIIRIDCPGVGDGFGSIMVVSFHIDLPDDVF